MRIFIAEDAIIFAVRLVLLLSFAAACSAGTAPESPRAGTTVFLTPPEHLVRASVALRGIRPSLDDLHAVAADPSQLPAIVDRYLDSAEFGATVRELHNEVFLLRAQRPELTPAPLPPLDDKSFTELNASVSEEPLRLIEDVVMSEQPYTAILTAGYTMADSIVATVWGLPHSADPGWERTIWTDGRPAVGILASSFMWSRHRSAATNYDRGRANMIARTLLCHDFLAGDVVLDTKVDLSDPAVVANAVVANPSCAACHQTLDPLASYFFSFRQGVVNLEQAQFPIELYRGGDAGYWLFTNGRPPRYFGQDVTDLGALGHAIAEDPRFARCAAMHFASYLTEVGEADLPAAWIAQLQQQFVASGYSAKQLAKAIVLSNRFRVSHDEDLVRSQGIVGYQKVRPAQLARMLYDLTGFTWTGSSDALLNGGLWKIGPYEYLDDDLNGFRVLAGGIDGYYVSQPVHTMNATSSLVAQRAAYLAAQYAVDHGSLVVATDDEPSVRAQLVTLHERIFGELDPDIEPTYQLWRSAHAFSRDARRAWIVTLTGMLSDLRALYY